MAPHIAVLALLAASPSLAVTKLRDSDDGRATIAVIEEHIRAANRLDSDVGKAKQQLAEAKTALEAERNASRQRLTPEERERRRAEAAKYPDAEVSRLEMAVKREQQRQLNAYTKIITEVAIAYGIEPAQRSGVSADTRTQGLSVTWAPRAHTPAERKVQLPDGSWRRVRKPRKDLSGATYADGVVDIDPSAFRNGIGYLATTIYHESIHFEQLITPGRGNLGGAFSEEEAYKAESDHKSDFFDAATPEGRAGIEDVDKNYGDAKADAEAYRRKLNGPLGSFFRLFPPQDLSEILQRRSQSDEELARIQSEAESLREHVAAENAARRQAQRARVPASTPFPFESASPAPPPAISAPYALDSISHAPLPARSPSLAPAAIAAASSPSEEMYLLAEAACRGDWNAAQSHFFIYPDLTPATLDGLLRRAEGSAYCTAGVLRRLVAMKNSGAAMTLERLQAETSAATNPPPDPGYIERESRQGNRPCVQRGVWYKDCY